MYDCAQWNEESSSFLSTNAGVVTHKFTIDEPEAAYAYYCCDDRK